MLDQGEVAYRGSLPEPPSRLADETPGVRRRQP